MKKISILLVLILVLSSCSITQQTYDFMHHGTESIKTNSNFKYVAKNVMGKAKTTYKISSYRNYKQQLAPDGLLSEAKSRLPELKANQAFANLSIDVVKTLNGKRVGATIDVKEITLEVVVSADIIEYY
jgi:PBP1b-binding outer membrane lipoprotein LpoB